MDWLNISRPGCIPVESRSEFRTGPSLSHTLLHLLFFAFDHFTLNKHNIVLIISLWSYDLNKTGPWNFYEYETHYSIIVLLQYFLLLILQSQIPMRCSICVWFEVTHIHEMCLCSILKKYGVIYFKHVIQLAYDEPNIIYKIMSPSLLLSFHIWFKSHTERHYET